MNHATAWTCRLIRTEHKRTSRSPEAQMPQRDSKQAEDESPLTLDEASFRISLVLLIEEYGQMSQRCTLHRNNAVLQGCSNCC